MIAQRHRQLVISLTRLGAVAAALLVLVVLVVTSSRAAFSDATTNGTNSFSTGSVVLTDDDTGSALFSATGLAPDNSLVECIELTYSGTLTPAQIRAYGTSTGGLDSYLDVTIEVGTGGSFGSCTGFIPTSTVYTGTLAGFAAAHASWAGGADVFTAATTPDVRTLRFTVTVQDDNAAQGLSATADFTFEAQA